jgi:histidyl-tRNA synthetase
MELIGGAPTPGVGWAAGIERMLLASGVPGEDESRAPVDLYVALAKPERRRTAFALAHEARAAGLAAQLESAGRSVKGQLKHADRLGARYVAVVGDEGTTLRDMGTGEERALPADLVVTAVLKDRL